MSLPLAEAQPVSRPCLVLTRLALLRMQINIARESSDRRAHPIKIVVQQGRHHTPELTLYFEEYDRHEDDGASYEELLTTSERGERISVSIPKETGGRAYAYLPDQ